MRQKSTGPRRESTRAPSSLSFSRSNLFPSLSYFYSHLLYSSSLFPSRTFSISFLFQGKRKRIETGSHRFVARGGDHNMRKIGKKGDQNKRRYILPRPNPPFIFLYIYTYEFTQILDAEYNHRAADVFSLNVCELDMNYDQQPSLPKRCGSRVAHRCPVIILWRWWLEGCNVFWKFIFFLLFSFEEVSD